MNATLMKQIFRGNEKITLYEHDKKTPLLVSEWKLKEFVKKHPEMEITKITIIKKGVLNVYISKEDAEKIDLQETFR